MVGRGWCILLPYENRTASKLGEVSFIVGYTHFGAMYTILCCHLELQIVVSD
jgi:hypothetical protein